jgi:hypothetical protein
MLSLSEQKYCLKRQLELVKKNQELTRDIEFRDYRIIKLEKELRDMQAIIRNSTESNQEKELNIIHERISIYV